MWDFSQNSFQYGCGRAADTFAYRDELQEGQGALTCFEAGDKRLTCSKSGGKIALRQSRLLPQFDQHLDDLFMRG
jgi:hypothetical protein